MTFPAAPILSSRAVGLFALAAAGGSFALPSPENLVVLLGAAGLGLGIGVGSGYATFIARTSKAKADAFKLWDDTTRGTVTLRLQEAEAELLKQGAEIQGLRAELAIEREITERTRAGLTEFALTVLHERGYVHPPEVPPR